MPSYQIKKRLIKKHNKAVSELSLKQKAELAEYCGASIETLYRQIRLRGELLAKPANQIKVKEILGLNDSDEIIESYKVKYTSRKKLVA